MLQVPCIAIQLKSPFEETTQQLIGTWSEEPHIMVAEVAAATSGKTPISSMSGPCIEDSKSPYM